MERFTGHWHCYKAFCVFVPLKSASLGPNKQSAEVVTKQIQLQIKQHLPPGLLRIS